MPRQVHKGLIIALGEKQNKGHGLQDSNCGLRASSHLKQEADHVSPWL